MKNLIERLEKVIEATPTGEHRELLTEINIFLHRYSRTEEKLSKQIAEKIFTDGFGRKANRLVMEFDKKFNECGWSKEAITDLIIEELKIAFNVAEIETVIENKKSQIENSLHEYLRGAKTTKYRTEVMHLMANEEINICNELLEEIKSKISL